MALTPEEAKKIQEAFGTPVLSKVDYGSTTPTPPTPKKYNLDDLKSEWANLPYQQRDEILSLSMKDKGVYILPSYPEDERGWQKFSGMRLDESFVKNSPKFPNTTISQGKNVDRKAIEDQMKNETDPWKYAQLQTDLSYAHKDRSEYDRILMVEDAINTNERAIEREKNLRQQGVGYLQQLRANEGTTGDTNIFNEFSKGFQRASQQALGAVAGSVEMFAPDDAYFGWLNDYAKTVADKSRADIIKSPELNRAKSTANFMEGGYKDPNYYANVLGSLIPHIAGAMTASVAGGLVGGGVGAAVGAGAYSFSMESGSLYNELLDKGYSLTDARNAAAQYGAVAAALDSILPAKIGGAVANTFTNKLVKESMKQSVKKTIGKTVLEFGKDVGIEATTEALQELSQNIAKSYFDENQDIWENVIDSFVGGALGGGVFGAIGAGNNQMLPEATETLPDNMRDFHAENGYQGKEAQKWSDPKVTPQEMDQIRSSTIRANFQRLGEVESSVLASIRLAEVIKSKDPTNKTVQEIQNEADAELTKVKLQKQMLEKEYEQGTKVDVVASPEFTMSVGEAIDGKFIANAELILESSTEVLSNPTRYDTRAEAEVGMAEMVSEFLGDKVQNSTLSETELLSLENVNKTLEQVITQPNPQRMIRENRDVMLLAQDMKDYGKFEKAVRKNNLLPEGTDLAKFYERAQSKEGMYITAREARSVVEKYAKDMGVSTQFVERMTTPQGKQALGSFMRDERVIKLVTRGEEGMPDVEITTPYHEVGHAYFQTMMTPEERANVLQEIKNNSKKELTDKEAEEVLVEDLRAYNDKKTLKALKKRIQPAYARLLDSIKEIVDKVLKWIGRSSEDKINQFYEDVLSMKRPSEKVAMDIEKQQEVYRETAQAKAELVVLHNTTIENLKKSVELGGLPVPSLAITKGSIPFTDFGDITLVGGSSIIDPSLDSRNKVFSVDAYTPRVPQEKYEVNKKLAASLYDKIYKDIPSDILISSKDSVFYNAFSDIQSLEDLQGNLYRTVSSLYLYAKENNLDPEIVYSDIKNEILTSSKTDIRKNLLENIDIINSITDRNFESFKKGGEVYEKISPIIDAYLDEIQSKTGDGEMYNNFKNIYYSGDGLSFGTVEGLIYDAKKINVSKKVVDEYDSLRKLQKQIDKADFNKWVSDKFGSIFGKKYFTKGNRNIDYTFENLVSAMSGNTIAQETGITDSGFGKLQAMGSKKLSSIKQIQKTKERLVSKEEGEATYERLKKEYADIGMDIEYKYENAGFFARMDDLISAFKKYFKGGKTIENLGYALRSQDFTPSPEMLQRAYKFAEEVMNIPMSYMEAKPQRGVYLSEFSGVVVPQEQYEQVRDVLRGTDLYNQIYTYRSQEERTAIVEKVAEESDVSFRESPSSLEQEALKYGSVEEFIKSQQDSTYKIAHEAPTRLDGESSNSADNVVGVYPEDIYSSNGARYYGDGSNFDQESISIIQSLRNKPGAKVTIYRAVPGTKTNQEMIDVYENQKKMILKNGRIPDVKFAEKFGLKNKSEYYDFISNEISRLQYLPENTVNVVKINPGDWVTINRKYAVEHGEHSLGGNYKILKKTVRAEDIFTDGNSIHEWGYDPKVGGLLNYEELTDIYNKAHGESFRTAEPQAETNPLYEEARKYNSSEEFLRAGGPSMESLSRFAFGFSDEDVKTLSPSKLNIKWKADIENVEFQIKKSGLSRKEWAKTVDLSEPIDVSYEKGKFFIEDGHHRYTAAKELGKMLNVTLEIKDKPIAKITGRKDFSYDDYVRSIWNDSQESFRENNTEDTAWNVPENEDMKKYKSAEEFANAKINEKYNMIRDRNDINMGISTSVETANNNTKRQRIAEQKTINALAKEGKIRTIKLGDGKLSPLSEKDWNIVRENTPIAYQEPVSNLDYNKIQSEYSSFIKTYNKAHGESFAYDNTDETSRYKIRGDGDIIKGEDEISVDYGIAEELGFAPNQDNEPFPAGSIRLKVKDYAPELVGKKASMYSNVFNSDYFPKTEVTTLEDTAWTIPEKDEVKKSVDDAMYEVAAEIEIAEAGQRYSVEYMDNGFQGVDNVAFSSTFPKWVSPDNRRKELLTRASEYLDGRFRIPPKNSPRLRSAVLDLYTEVARLSDGAINIQEIEDSFDKVAVKPIKKRLKYAVFATPITAEDLQMVQDISDNVAKYSEVYSVEEANDAITFLKDAYQKERELLSRTGSPFPVEVAQQLQAVEEYALAGIEDTITAETRALARNTPNVDVALLIPSDIIKNSQNVDEMVAQAREYNPDLGAKLYEMDRTELEELYTSMQNIGTSRPISRLESVSERLEKNIQAEKVRNEAIVSRLTDARIKMVQMREARAYRQTERNRVRNVARMINLVDRKRIKDLENEVKMSDKQYLKDIYKAQAKGANAASLETTRILKKKSREIAKYKEMLGKVESLRKRVQASTRTGGRYYVEYARKLLAVFDEYDTSSLSNRSMEKLQDIYEMMYNNEKISDEMKDWYRKNIERVSKKSLRDMTYDELNELYDMLSSLANKGAFELAQVQYFSEEEKQRRIALAIESTKNMDGSGRKGTTRTEMSEGAFKEALTRTGLDVLTPVAVMDKFDGTKNFTGWNAMQVRSLQKGEQMWYSQLHQATEELKTRIQEIKPTFTKNEETFLSLVARSREEADGAVKNLMEQLGVEIIPSQIDNLTLEQAEQIIDVIEDISQKYEMSTQLKTIFEARTNKPFPLKKHYVAPLKYTNRITDTTDADIEAMQNIADYGTEIGEGMAISRMEKVDLEVRTDLLTLVTEGWNHSLYYINMQPRVDNIQSVVGSKEFKEHAGRIVSKYWKEYLSQVANKGKSMGQGTFDVILRNLRQNFQVAILGFKATTVLLQPTAGFNAVMTAYAMHGTDTALSIMAELAQAYVVPSYKANALSQSEALTIRAGSAGSTDFAEINKLMETGLADLRGNYSKVKAGAIKAGMYMIQEVDIRTASAVRQGMYKALIARGVPEAKASADADFFMSLSQSSTQLVDRPLILSRYGEFGRLFFTFQTFTLGLWSMITQGLIVNGIIKGTPQVKMKSALALVAIPFFTAFAGEMISMVNNLIKGKDDDEDLEDKLKNSLENTWIELVATVPLFGSIVKGKILYNRNYEVPVVGTFLDALEGVQGLMSAEDYDDFITKFVDTSKAAAIIAGLPGAFQAGDIINRLIVTEKEKKQIETRAAARAYIDAKEVNLDKYVTDLIMKLYTKEEIKNLKSATKSSLKTSILKEVVRLGKNDEAKNVLKLSKNEEKADYLKEIRDQYTPAEFKQLVNYLKKYKVLSDDAELLIYKK